MRSRQFALVGSAAVAAIAPAVALGHTSKAAYDWHVGDALLQSFGFPVAEQAIAPNGDVVTLEGTGSFSADGKWATGTGTFSHHVAATDATITGTFTADGVISFQFYGCGEDAGEPLPPDFCGGLLKLGDVADARCRARRSSRCCADDQLRDWDRRAGQRHRRHPPQRL